jgi:hypothetical protein
MNDKTGGNRFLRCGATLAVVSAVAVLATACGGGSASSPPNPGSSGSETVALEVALAQCVRAHGVPDFPDPDPAGGFSSLSATMLESSQMQAAYGTCRHLLPNGGPSLAGIQAQIQAATQRADVALLPFAQCMHTHGVPDFPEPPQTLKGAGINPQSPQFLAAVHDCGKLMPAGFGLTVTTTGEKVS